MRNAISSDRYILRELRRKVIVFKFNRKNQEYETSIIYIGSLFSRYFFIDGAIILSSGVFVWKMSDYSITYDKNDAQEQKDVYICDGNKSVVRIDSYKWNSSSSDWVYDGKTVMENDNQGRTLVAISYSAADVAGEKTEYTYTGNGYEKFSVTSSSFEEAHGKPRRKWI